MSIASVPVSSPARDASDAARKFTELAARDDASISVAGRSRAFVGSGRSALAVVLLHGLTNAPQQWEPFARQLYARGHNVVIPRLPGHGAADLRGRSLADVSASATIATVGAAIDIACGLGERVVVCGLSIGAALATRLSFERGDVARTIALVPFFGLRGFPEFGDAVAATLLRVAPNVFVSWDPKGAGGQVPPYAYPRFPTRALGRMLEIGCEVVRSSKTRVPTCETVLGLNAHEPAIDNGLAREVAARFEGARAGAARVLTWTDLPANHDIVDPTNVLARVDLVYPRIVHEIERPFG